MYKVRKQAAPSNNLAIHRGVSALWALCFNLALKRSNSGFGR